MYLDTETHCHCGAEYSGSDHCPECGCEQFESYACSWPEIRAARIARHRASGAIRNACGHWSDLNPIRHVACRDLPPDECALSAEVN